MASLVKNKFEIDIKSKLRHSIKQISQASFSITLSALIKKTLSFIHVKNILSYNTDRQHIRKKKQYKFAQDKNYPDDINNLSSELKFFQKKCVLCILGIILDIFLILLACIYFICFILYISNLYKGFRAQFYLCYQPKIFLCLIFGIFVRS